MLTGTLLLFQATDDITDRKSNILVTLDVTNLLNATIASTDDGIPLETLLLYILVPIGSVLVIVLIVVVVVCYVRKAPKRANRRNSYIVNKDKPSVDKTTETGNCDDVKSDNSVQKDAVEDGLNGDSNGSKIDNWV